MLPALFESRSALLVTRQSLLHFPGGRTSESKASGRLPQAVREGVRVSVASSPYFHLLRKRCTDQTKRLRKNRSLFVGQSAPRQLSAGTRFRFSVPRAWCWS